MFVQANWKFCLLETNILPTTCIVDIYLVCLHARMAMIEAGHLFGQVSYFNGNLADTIRIFPFIVLMDTVRDVDKTAEI